MCTAGGACHGSVWGTRLCTQVSTLTAACYMALMSCTDGHAAASCLIVAALCPLRPHKANCSAPKAPCATFDHVTLCAAALCGTRSVTAYNNGCCSATVGHTSWHTTIGRQALCRCWRYLAYPINHCSSQCDPHMGMHEISTNIIAVLAYWVEALLLIDYNSRRAAIMHLGILAPDFWACRPSLLP